MTDTFDLTTTESTEHDPIHRELPRRDEIGLRIREYLTEVSREHGWTHAYEFHPASLRRIAECFTESEWRV